MSFVRFARLGAVTGGSRSPQGSQGNDLPVMVFNAAAAADALSKKQCISGGGSWVNGACVLPKQQQQGDSGGTGGGDPGAACVAGGGTWSSADQLCTMPTTTATPAFSLASVPTWAWIAAGLAAYFIFFRKKGSASAPAEGVSDAT